MWALTANNASTRSVKAYFSTLGVMYNAVSYLVCLIYKKRRL